MTTGHQIKRTLVPLPADGQATVADYGCSEGRNSMTIVGEAR